MSLRSTVAVVLLAATACCAAPLAWAQDASIKQVFQAAEAGKFIEAQAMMDKVLRDHPNSGKAHFIEAELLAKQGKFTQAGAELATAERLAPGLPFAKPAAVASLR
ncbi:MAG: tetratricopeptide repeat protein, partial [Pseudomonadota bacterium]|nr:tetratricopeptide repeat protein [Pseudomonadota bacterium]